MISMAQKRTKTWNVKLNKKTRTETPTEIKGPHIKMCQMNNSVIHLFLFTAHMSLSSDSEMFLLCVWGRPSTHWPDSAVVDHVVWLQRDNNIIKMSHLMRELKISIRLIPKSRVHMWCEWCHKWILNMLDKIIISRELCVIQEDKVC